MAINHKAAKEFAKRWSGKKWSEDQYARTFWMDLLKSVYEIEYNDTNNVIFEYRTSASGKIDLWLRNLSTMVEMKSSGVDLDKPEPRQGELKTPFKQVYDYAVSFPRNEQPDYLITCNFDKFRVYSRKEYGDLNLEKNGQEFSLDDLGNKPEYLSFLVDPKNSRLYHEREISETAGQLIGTLYEKLRGQYIDPDTEEAKHSLNVLCVRLVFCLFCEDMGLFGEMDAFYNFLKDVPAMNIRSNLQRLFTALDTPKEKRDPYDIPLKVFPYVNGGLFSKTVEIPNFTDDIKDFLLKELSQNVDWSKISPTIFGGIFESTLNPDTRRQGGMHYTSPENIHKVIDPLFLDDLVNEFESIRNDDDLSVIQKRNRYKKFHSKICSLVFFDPACGSGNFLTETYLSLRKLEYAVLNEYKSKQISAFDSSAEGDIEQRVKLDQFYGIEINDFAVSVAETALWISRLKANAEGVIVYDLDERDFPLEDRANVIQENALTFDWNDLIEPSKVSYIMGNPPFVGYSNQSDDQKSDLAQFSSLAPNYSSLDYVAGWYFKTANYIGNYKICCAYVSTNSISQGEQVVWLWRPLYSIGINIDFAYQPFVWSSESSDTAHVHCVIIGFSRNSTKEKRIYTSDGHYTVTDNINPYLVSAPTVFVESRSTSICKNTLGKMQLGIDPTDYGNLTFSDEDKNEFVSKEPSAEKFFRKYLDGRSFIHGVVRWYLDLQNCENLDEYPLCKQRVMNVIYERSNAKSAATRKRANDPLKPKQGWYPDSDYLIVPRVSSERRKYIPIGFCSKDIVSSMQNQVIPNAEVYHFGVLISSIHMIWMRTVAGRLKSDYRYSAGIVYNNFPWPNPTNSQKEIIEQTAQGILDARLNHPKKNLAELYAPDNMPNDLREAHKANDEAVMSAYGFSYDMTESDIIAELMKLYQTTINQTSE